MILIVGANGDLGSKLLNQLTTKGIEVVGFDILNVRNKSRDCIDPNLTFSGKIEMIENLKTIDKVNIVHWCAPLDSFSDEIKHQFKNKVVVLHDSVMANSKHFADTNKIKAQIVHITTNVRTTVFVAEEFRSELIVNHFKAAGLEPVSIGVDEHDLLMAKSQSLIALLCLKLLPDLKEKESKGLLTPSGSALVSALSDRQSNWTSNTFETIINNPKLKIVINELIEGV